MKPLGGTVLVAFSRWSLTYPAAAAVGGVPFEHLLVYAEQRRASARRGEASRCISIINGTIVFWIFQHFSDPVTRKKTTQPGQFFQPDFLDREGRKLTPSDSMRLLCEDLVDMNIPKAIIIFLFAPCFCLFWRKWARKFGTSPTNQARGGGECVRIVLRFTLNRSLYPTCFYSLFLQRESSTPPEALEPVLWLRTAL